MPNVRAVLFDLDGTLLPLNIDTFMKRYLAALVGFYQRELGVDVLPATMAGVQKIFAATGDRIVNDIYAESVTADLGVSRERLYGIYEQFVTAEGPSLQEGIEANPAARAAVEAARRAGKKTALATMPVFPRTFTLMRLQWSGVAAESFEAITSIETSRYCKPHPGYFKETAAMIGVEPGECLMVGNDLMMDLESAAAAGMATCLVEGPYAVLNSKHFRADHTVRLDALPALVASL